MIETHLRGIKFYVHDNEDISKAILRDQDFYEKHILDYIQQRYPTQKTIVDIGAMIGNHVVYFANYFQHTRIIAFEPISDNFELLRINAAIYPTVTLYNKAVSNTCGKLIMERHQFNWGMHGVEYPQEESQYWTNNYDESQRTSVECITLDSLNLQDVTLLKIDVELHEPKVLEGAADTIQRCKPLIMIEDIPQHYSPLLPNYRLVNSWEKDFTYLYEWEDKC